MASIFERFTTRVYKLNGQDDVSQSTKVRLYIRKKILGGWAVVGG